MDVSPVYFVIFALCCLFVPIIAIATENSDKRTGRMELAFWFFGRLFCMPALILFVGAAAGQPAAAMKLALVYCTVMMFFVYRRFVRRARDAGMGKTIAYLTVVPFVSLIAIPILLFKKSADPAHGSQSAVVAVTSSPRAAA